MLRLITATIALFMLLATAAFAISEATVKSFEWPDDSTYEFAIFSSQTGERIATAYYRVVKDVTEGRDVYRFKYHARNEMLSEAAECWVYPDTMLPLRSTRKTTDQQRTYFQDFAYGNGTILVRRKTDNGPVSETTVPAAGRFYDYESLIWLIPQLDFRGDDQTYINVFVTLNEAKSTVLIKDEGPQQITILGKTYVTHGYTFNVNSAKYNLYTVLEGGHEVPARVDMGTFSFLNMHLNPDEASAQPAPAPPTPAPSPEPEPEPEPEEEEDPADPGANPLGPPPPGSRF